ncbi:MAG: 4Fe-4S cluster-binding domain-containing protein [Alphaproteobacteria bacterium]|nr:4Fe-4S cluster-binding domain-containing protein [Alphaproteobacteria bacterium]
MTNLWDKEQEVRRICMLMITHNCNLNCSYCYEKYKSAKKMNFETAIFLIKKEIKKVKQSKKNVGLEIDLMGGEPMMNFPLIKQLIEWADSGNIDVPYIFSITTNGTLFHDKEKKWFKKHKQSIVCSCSFDGNTDMQKTNRGEGATDVDLDFFCKTWPKQGLHMTISKETLPKMADGIIYIQKKGYKIEASLAEGINWDKYDVVLYQNQLEKLAQFYLDFPDIKPLNLLTRLNYVVDPRKDKKKITKYCGTGTFMTAYDPDGQSYGCHMFSPIVLGKKAIKIKDINFKKCSIVNDDICNKCILKHFCPTCAGFNFKYRGNLGTRDKRKCLLHLEEARISSIFQIKLIAARKKELSIEDVQHLKKSLRTIELIKQIKDRNYPFQI